MNPGTSLPNSQQRSSATIDDHVIPWLWNAFATHQAEPWLTAEQATLAAQHLGACEACRAELGALASMADAAQVAPPALSALLAHVDPGLVHDPLLAAIPEDEDLALYIARSDSTNSEPTSLPRPAIFAHIEVCPLCQAEATSIVAMLDAAHPDATEAQTAWEQPNAWVRRLRAPYQIWVQPQALRITSTLANPQIETQESPAAPLSGQRFTVTIDDDLAAYHDAQIQVQIEMHALFAQRIAGSISALRTIPGVAPEPADGVSWRLDSLVSSASESPGRSGKTDNQGSASFSMHGFGDYLFTFIMAGREWIVPITIHPDVTME